ncbi:MAG: 3-hydroxyacyl-CoA dehydrogenase/enoyl-CoA hydratase family protein [Flavobacteriia bacterium]|nr:3-hydroxyacyl-CoA dehydrogenase/enoyl-CoA hydratase family protein [Flavobacteriia bacterium]
MKRHIRKVAVLGSGVMGSRIACHFANIACEVILLDIIPNQLNDVEVNSNLTLNDKKVRNRIVNDALLSAIQSNPSPLYLKSFSSRIKTGNFEDDLNQISSCDWVIEAVIENLDIKKNLYEKIEKFRKPGTLISTNTSGIPLQLLVQNRSEDFKTHFCGTHFFNPPRYLPLLEIIPSEFTSKEVLDFLHLFGTKNLGKKVVLCKDTPAFIANRVGVFSIFSLFHLTEKYKFSVEQIDFLTGSLIGRPKSATYRTCDVVGLDTLVHVANGLRTVLNSEEEKVHFELPSFIQKMIENKLLGSKTKKGFYQKTKEGIDFIDLESIVYKKSEKKKIPEIEEIKIIEDIKLRFQQIFQMKGNIGDFYKDHFGSLFYYVSSKIPEITDSIYDLDEAIKSGFGWDLGPFEIWDAIGIKKGIELIENSRNEVPFWISNLAGLENPCFYKTENKEILIYDQNNNIYLPLSNPYNFILPNIITLKPNVWNNSECTLKDLGDGILHLDWNSKMNTIGSQVIEGIHHAIDLAEQSFQGLVIHNTGSLFSAGANVGLIFMMAAEQELDELNFAVKTFQDTMMRIRYSSIPVVVAPYNLCLGGGCELSMHADKVIAHAELYMGLVEFGVGLIPGGGGTKEFAKRLSEELKEGDVSINRFRDRFLTIGQAKVSTSAHEAFELGYLRKGIDEIVMNKQQLLKTAKEVCLLMAENSYQAPIMEKNIKVLGNEALGLVYVGANSMFSGNYISEHDQLISEKLGFVLAGGDLSEPTFVSEQYLLDLERKTFLELSSQRKTLERMQSLVKTGKILRN